LFVEKHLERFQNSTYLAGITFKFDTGEIAANIIKLAKANKINAGNVKLVYVLNSSSRKIEFGEILIYFIPHHYPEQCDYQRGVKIVTLFAERLNPNAKIIQAELRKQANELINQKNVFEVLLVNKDGFITEGSRSNVFFISGNQVVTSPLKMILPGITRELVIDICNKGKIAFAEQFIHVSRLTDFQAAFITGTSPKVLPVSSIDKFKFDPQHVITQNLMAQYDQVLSDYIKNFGFSNSISNI
jgi:branched-chain amino acid aminotransferase